MEASKSLFMFSCWNSHAPACMLTFMSQEPVAPSRVSIFVNGRTRQVSGAMTLGELAADCRLDARRLLVELNGETLPRDTWPAHAVQHGDRIEFIRVVAGG